ncbi:uncharacterized protein [Antedon mediterranea]|uniref:uncharacterized protein n=1 Tax=Antedon mediterranea TaxID=105859 RepID=UPI003AF6F477
MHCKFVFSVFIALFSEAMMTQAILNSKLFRSKRKAAECIPRGDALSDSICDRVIPIPDNIREEFSLDSFYHNYTHAYGIPILSSGAVSENAMLRACYTVRFMLADRQDVRNAMHNNCARVSVIGLKEVTNQIPEYSHLDDSTNDRARGIGGTLKNPVTTVGEENLKNLNYTIDRWHNEDIGVHEFAHAIHKIGMNTIDSKFNTRMRDAYLAAKAAGLWNKTYAQSNKQEYFAEGVQKFFSVDVVQEHTDGVHNNISNRSELFDYDIGLYNLALETFPCANIIVPREDDQSLIETQELKMDCDGTPTTTKQTTTDAHTTTIMDRKDSDFCDIYAYQSKYVCRSNVFIRMICPNLCDVHNVCENVHAVCNMWRNMGYCDTKKKFMLTNCKKKCQWC